LEISRNTFKIVEILWKFLEILQKLYKCLENPRNTIDIICISIFFAAMAQQQASPLPQLPVGGVRPHREPL
jgi:hypothetical protein